MPAEPSSSQSAAHQEAITLDHPIFFTQERFTPADVLDYVRQPGISLVPRGCQEQILELRRRSVQAIDSLVTDYTLSMNDAVTEGSHRVAFYSVAEAYWDRATQILHDERSSHDKT